MNKNSSTSSWGHEDTHDNDTRVTSSPTTHRSAAASTARNQGNDSNTPNANDGKSPIVHKTVYQLRKRYQHPTNTVPQERKKRAGRTLFCPCCNFSSYDITKKKEMIELHMMLRAECRSTLLECGSCNKMFLAMTDYKRHVETTTNDFCRVVYNQKMEIEKYSTTEVLISDCPQSKSNDEESLNNYEIIYSQSSQYTCKDCIVPQFTKELNNQTDNIDDTIVMPDSEEGNKKIAATEDTSMDNIDTESNCQWDANEEDTNENAPNANDINVTTADDSNVPASDESNVPAAEEGNDIELNQERNITTQPQEEVSFQSSDVFVSLLNQRNEEIREAFNNNEFNDSVDLIALLISKKISLHFYDDFMKWKHNKSTENRAYPSLDSVVKNATSKIYGSTLSQKMNPIVKPINLLSGRRCHVVTFDVTATIFDLLDDDIMHTHGNTIFEERNGNPFCIREQSVYNDIDTCSVYKETYDAEGINPENDVLCPIALFIDELKLDAFGKLGLEPVVMTLLILNRETRNKHIAHRVIGYMPNFHMMFGGASYDADAKADDYHQCLSVILEGIKSIQHRDGYKWIFKFKEYPGSTFERTLKFPLFYVIGDAKGNDILAGRYMTRVGTNCIARDCNILFKLCDDPRQRCRFHKQKEMWTKSAAELHMLSFRKLRRNAFQGIWFGQQPYGLFAALPPEPLHLFNLGIVERLPQTFFNRLSKEQLKTLDRHSGFICTHFSKQSDRGFPVLDTFISGVTETSRLTAKEKLARVFCMYLTLLTNDFQSKIVGTRGKDMDVDLGFCGIISQREYNNWIEIFEQTLLLSSWIYREEHPKVFFQGGRKSLVAMRIRKFMALYRKRAPRNQGVGLKIVKFHQLNHLWWVIRLFGSLLNVDGARGESHNQYIAKAVGKSTQQHHQSLNYQTACNYYKRELLMKAFNAGPLAKVDHVHADDEGHDNQVYPCATGSKFKLSFKYDTQKLESEWISYKLKGKECKFSPLIMTSVFHKLKLYNAGTAGRRIKSICGFTEFQTLHEGTVDTYRACPYYRGKINWHDWAMFNWVDETAEDTGTALYAAQLLMLLDTRTIQFESFPEAVTRHQPIGPRYLAFVHSTKGSHGSKTMPTSQVIGQSTRGFRSQIAQWFDMEDKYQMIDLSTLERKCFVLVDTMNENRHKCYSGTAKKVVLLSPKDEWSSKFIDYNDDIERNRAERIVDETVVDPEVEPFED